MRVLLIEDDLDLGKGLLKNLSLLGFACTWVRDLASAYSNFAKFNFDIALLDLGLSDGDGMDWLESVRSAGSDVPVIVISARDSVVHRINALNSGADDFLTKPFSMQELESRINALIRRHRGMSLSEISVKGVLLNRKSMRVYVDGVAISISPTEFNILSVLMFNPNEVITRKKIERAVFNGSDSCSLDMHISNLRRKLPHGFIRTVRGIGFVVDDLSS